MAGTLSSLCSGGAGVYEGGETVSSLGGGSEEANPGDTVAMAAREKELV